MPRIRILVTTRPENCALRAVRQGAPAGTPPSGDTAKITLPLTNTGARRPAPDPGECRRATTQMDDRPSVRSRYSPTRPISARSRVLGTRKVLLDLDGGAGALE